MKIWKYENMKIWKYEKLISDLFKFAENVTVIEAKRNEEYIPSNSTEEAKKY
jgi:hypothetical protein